MIKYFNGNSKNSLKKLELILSKRKINQLSQSSYIKKILFNVKNQGDQAIINYEKNFQKLVIIQKNKIFK